MMRRLALIGLLLAVVAFMLSATCALAQEQRISLELKDADVKSSLSMLFKNQPGKSYVIEGGATGIVNVSLRDVPWEQALRAILDSANLTWVKDGDIYHIRPATMSLAPAPLAPEVSTPSLSPVAANAPYSRAPTSEGTIYMGIVPVLHASVFDMARWFGGSIASSSSVTAAASAGLGIGQAGVVGATPLASGASSGTSSGTATRSTFSDAGRGT